MLQRTTLNAPQEIPSRYVYVKMMRDNVDVTEGKTPKGAVLIIPEDKASRWCFRSHVARPATQEEYDRYQDKMFRKKGGVGIRRSSKGIQIPDENPFHYVEAQAAEYDEDDLDEDELQFVSPSERRRRVPRQEINDLSSRMASTENEFETVPDEDSLEEDIDHALENPTEEDSEEEEDSDEDDESSEGVYDAAISRGPGETVEDPTNGSRGRGRRGRRGR